MQESELIELLIQGKEEAYAGLYHLFGSRVYNTALSFIQNKEDAEEITQDVFVEVFQSVKKFKLEAKIST